MQLLERLDWCKRSHLYKSIWLWSVLRENQVPVWYFSSRSVPGNHVSMSIPNAALIAWKTICSIQSSMLMTDFNQLARRSESCWSLFYFPGVREQLPYRYANVSPHCGAEGVRTTHIHRYHARQLQLASRICYQTVLIWRTSHDLLSLAKSPSLVFFNLREHRMNLYQCI